MDICITNRCNVELRLQLTTLVWVKWFTGILYEQICVREFVSHASSRHFVAYLAANNRYSLHFFYFHRMSVGQNCALKIFHFAK